MQVVDFLPTYKEFDKDIIDILGEYADTKSIYDKREFREYKLAREEILRPGEFMNHQIIVSRFLSSNTPYKGILVMHEPGTGKTCLSVAVIEGIKAEKNNFKGALILMKGKTLIDNYKKDLVDNCTDGRYKITNEDETYGYDDEYSLVGTDMEHKLKRRINKKLAVFYEFNTFETFSRMLESQFKSGLEDELIQRYSNRIIVIDEAHHLREDESESKEVKGQYETIKKLLGMVVNCKVILMTGTPMTDTAIEIASLLNLILDVPLPTGKNFEREYMVEKDGDLVLNPVKINELKTKLHGKVSFLRAVQSTVSRKFMGEKLDLKHFNQYALPLEEYQRQHYLEALELDRNGEMKTGKDGKDRLSRSIYTNSKAASLFVFPDGSFGKTGYAKYTNGKEITDQLEKDLFGDVKDVTERLTILERYSVKYANCIRLLLEKEGNHFVYMDSVHGSGAIVFSKILSFFGFGNFNSKSRQKYALCTSRTSGKISKIISLFNSDENVMGAKIKVIVGTNIISEGFTLKNVQYVHILTPHWNFSEMDQVIARAFRLASHRALKRLYGSEESIMVEIYLYTIVVDESDDLSIDEFQSIDRYMYKKCEDKDISIKSVEHLLKQVSFDCLLTKERNTLPDKFNRTRNCEYENCDYTCYDEMGEEDESTFNLFYDKKEIVKCIEQIRGVFSTTTICSFDELSRVVSSEQILLKSILYCMENKVVFSKSGLNCFLQYTNDNVFLTFSLESNNPFDSFYTAFDPLQIEFNLDSEIDREYNKELLKLCEELPTKPENWEKLPWEIQQLLFEGCYIEQLAPPAEKDPYTEVRKYIVDKYKDCIKEYKTGRYLSKFGKNLRCLDARDGKKPIWVDCDTNVVEKEMKMEKNEYNFTGFYEEGKFKIKRMEESVDVEDLDQDERIKFVVRKGKVLKPKLDKESAKKMREIAKKTRDQLLSDLKDIDLDLSKFSDKELGQIVYFYENEEELIDAINYKDKRVDFRGKECTSWSKKELFELLIEIRKKHGRIIDAVVPQNTKSREELVEKIKSEVGEFDFSDFGEDEIQRLAFFLTKKEIFCDAIEKFLKEVKILDLCPKIK